MFWVINKDKVYSYMVTLSVIGVLLVMATMVIPNSDAMVTSTTPRETMNAIVD